MVEISKTACLRSFGARVRVLRLAAGLSQEDLAARSGMHRTYVGAVERGERNISLINIIRMSRALSVDAGALLSGL
jgi:transcriptional regulator with XRE-family HTH domain